MNMGHHVLYEWFSPTPACPMFISETQSPRDMTHWFITFEYGTWRSTWMILAESGVSHDHKCDEFTSGHDSFVYNAHTATHCNTLQHTATHCNTLQHTATHCNALQRTATFCNILQHTATHAATRCNTLQHAATHCNLRVVAAGR